jgi:hypothetical protein
LPDQQVDITLPTTCLVRKCGSGSAHGTDLVMAPEPVHLEVRIEGEDNLPKNKKNKTRAQSDSV